MILENKIYNLILEKKLTATDGLKSKLQFVFDEFGDEVALGLIQYLNGESEVDDKFPDNLDIDENDYILFKPYNKQNSEKISIGKLAARLELGNTKEIETFVNRYKTTYNKFIFKLIEDETIPDYFLETNCAEIGPISNSCMNGQESQPNLRLYHKLGAKLLVMLDDAGIVQGRAVIWDKLKYMDRIYYSSDWIVEDFIRYAKKQGWSWKVKQSTTGYDDPTIPDLKWPCRIGKTEKRPFMDTFCYYYETDNWTGLVSKIPVVKSERDYLISNQTLSYNNNRESIVETFEGELEWDILVSTIRGEQRSRREWTKIWGAWYKNTELVNGKPPTIPKTILEWCQLHYPKFIKGNKLVTTSLLDLKDFMLNTGAKHDIMIVHDIFPVSLGGDVNFNLIDGDGHLELHRVDLTGKKIQHTKLHLTDCNITDTTFQVINLNIAFVDIKTGIMPKSIIAGRFYFLSKNIKIEATGKIITRHNEVSVEEWSSMVICKGDIDIQILNAGSAELTGCRVHRVKSNTNVKLNNCIVIDEIITPSLYLTQQPYIELDKLTIEHLVLTDNKSELDWKNLDIEELHIPANTDVVYDYSEILKKVNPNIYIKGRFSEEELEILRERNIKFAIYK